MYQTWSSLQTCKIISILGCIRQTVPIRLSEDTAACSVSLLEIYSAYYLSGSEKSCSKETGLIPFFPATFVHVIELGSQWQTLESTLTSVSSKEV